MDNKKINIYNLCKFNPDILKPEAFLFEMVYSSLLQLITLEEKYRNIFKMFFSSFEVVDCEALPDCDTEFIHFSESMASPVETLASLETFQPTTDHQQYAAMMKQLQLEGPEIVRNQTTLLQSHYTIVSDTSTLQDNTR